MGKSNALEKLDMPATGSERMDRVSFIMFVVCLAAMALTIAVTWPLWQARSTPPNLPLVSFLPQISFGPLLLGSLALALALPRAGFLVHVVLLLAAIACDQIRCQPQVFSLPILMAACLFRDFRMVGCWFLVALWFWAGTHKLLSPEWLGPGAWTVLTELGFAKASQWYREFAWVVALGEIALAIVAVWKPRWGAFFCLALHLGIAAILIGMDWNFSVLFWNLAMAFVGCWLLSDWGQRRQSTVGQQKIWPRIWWQQALVIGLLISPAGFYSDYMPSFLSHTLYSDNLVKGMVTTDRGPVEIETWDTLHVPIPKTRGILRDYFSSIAKPGEKLHLLDPRPWVADSYYMAGNDSRIYECTPSEFWSASGVGRGIAKDYGPCVFNLQEAGARLLKRSEEGMIYAVEIPPSNYSTAVFSNVEGLLNLEQINVAGCPVKDMDVSHLANLPVLVGVDLSGTDITDEALQSLEKVPQLRQLFFEETSVTADSVRTRLPHVQR